MCVLLFSIRQNERYPFVLAANRDEFYDRPAHAAGYWQDFPAVLAGRDELASGTWLGINRNGRFAAVTNHTDSADFDPSRISRGNLTEYFLTGDASPEEYLADLDRKSNRYNGYGLVFGTMSGLHYHSNRGAASEFLAYGTYGLGNDLLHKPWPRVQLGIQRLGSLMSRSGALGTDALFNILADDSSPNPVDDATVPHDSNLPLFVRLANYGTRCSTAIMIDCDGHVVFEERTFENRLRESGIRKRYEFEIERRLA